MSMLKEKGWYNLIMKNKRLIKSMTAFLALILCTVPVSIYAVEKEEIIAPEDKISEELLRDFDVLEKQNKDLTKEEIPVWIWYNDIDQKQVDKEVKEKTGLTTENLAVDFEMPNPAIINNLKNEKMGNQVQLQSYLARTAVARRLEQQRAYTYIMERRNIAKEKYIEKLEKVKTRLNIKNSDIIRKSRYAPVVMAKLTKEEISTIVKDKLVESVGLYRNIEAQDYSLETIKNSIGLTKIYSKLGLYGDNVKIGMIEGGSPESVPGFDNSHIIVVGNNVAEENHATNTAIILEGVAPDATIYSTNCDPANIELMLDQGIQIINMSAGYSKESTLYNFWNKWANHICAQHNVLLICSAGNWSNSQISAPAMAYNTLAVSGYTDMETQDNNDDIMVDNSYLDGNECKKPDLIAPQNLGGGGTSSSAPVVTGVAALLLELKPSLGYQPQTLKAILMASCQRKVQSPAGAAAETMAQGLTERQGAGAVDAWNAVCIVAQGNYGYGKVTSATEKRNFVQPSYGASHMNVSIAWLRENTISSNNHASGTVTAGTQHDLDLRVYRNGTLVGSSANANSSTEMAYFPLSASEARYQIRVSKEDLTNLETVRYGYAWCTDNMAFRENLTGTDNPEGIYYIRNKSNANGAYLTVDEETGQITQEAFTGKANQQWVSSKTGYDPFTIQTNSSAYPGYLSVSGQTSAWVRQDSAQYVYFGGNGYDNTYGIQLYGLPSSNSRSLTALDVGAQSSMAIWQSIGIPERFQWYFEPVGYKRGDVNRDGTISTADALLAQRYVGKLVTFDAAQRFLGDMNNDGQINTADVNLIQQAVSA